MTSMDLSKQTPSVTVTINMTGLEPMPIVRHQHAFRRQCRPGQPGILAYSHHEIILLQVFLPPQGKALADAPVGVFRHIHHLTG